MVLILMRMGHQSTQQSQSILVPMTGCLKDILRQWVSWLIMKVTIVDEQTKKIMTDMNISNLLQCLGGTVTHQTVIDSRGVSRKRIIITYDEQQGK